MNIKIGTYISEIGDLTEKVHEDEKLFSEWESCEYYLKDRIKLKRNRELFVTKIGDKKFSELDGNNFRKLENIKSEFFKNLESKRQNIEDAERKKIGKFSRIEIRIDEKEKVEVFEKCKKLKMNISEYTRELYKHGEIRNVPEQFQKDIRGMAINLNQIAKKINTGTISQSGAITELEKLLIDLKNSISK